MKKRYLALISSALILCMTLVLSLATGAFAHAATDLCKGQSTDGQSTDHACLAISVTATPHYTQTTAWTIDKSVSPDFLNLSAGGTGTATYQVELTKGNTTSAASIDSQVCIENTGLADTHGLVVLVRLIAEQPFSVIDDFIQVNTGEVPATGQQICFSHTLPIPVKGISPVTDAYGVGVKVSATNVSSSECLPNCFVTQDVTLPGATPVHASVNVADTFNSFMAGPFTTDQPNLTYQRSFSCGSTRTVANTAIVLDADTGALLDSASASLSVICPSVPPTPVPTQGTTTGTTTTTVPGLPNTGSQPYL